VLLVEGIDEKESERVNGREEHSEDRQ